MKQQVFCLMFHSIEIAETEQHTSIVSSFRSPSVLPTALMPFSTLAK